MRKHLEREEAQSCRIFTVAESDTLELFAKTLQISVGYDANRNMHKLSYISSFF